MTSTLRRSVNETLDLVADRLVIPGYSAFGYALRQRWWPKSDPVHEALSGKHAIVTGSSSGIGLSIAAGLAQLGAHVCLAVRNMERGEQARRSLLGKVECADVSVGYCDVSDLDSVRGFAAEIRASWPTLDVLVHNAGVMPDTRRVSAQGHELTLATHVLGPLLLTDSLREQLAQSDDARVIVMSSGGMYTQKLPLPPTDIEFARGQYNGAKAYARTKRVQVALIDHMCRRYADQGTAVFAMHPGWVATPGVAASIPRFERVTRRILRTPEQGADTAVWLAATQPAPHCGGFWQDRAERPIDYLPRTRTTDDQVEAVWSYCAEAAGLSETD